MRKIYAIRIFVLLLLAGAVEMTGYSQDLPPRTQLAHYLGDYEAVEPPVIDGIIDDDAWTYAPQGNGLTNTLNNLWFRYQPSLPVDDPGQPCIIDGEVPDDADDLSCKAWIIYDDEYLYVAVAVTDWDWVNAVDTNEEDGNTWNDDSVEVFVDGNHNRVEGDVNNHPEEYETGGQFVITSFGARRDVEAGNPTFGDSADAEWFAAVLENDDYTGFNYEFRIKLSKIGNPKKGDTVGFNLAINDADTSPGQRDTQFVWAGVTHQESTYGNLYFGRQEVTAPLITEEIIIDGKMDEAIWAVAGTGKSNPFEGPSQEAIYPSSIEDAGFEFYVLHDATYLYVTVDVSDSDIRTDTEPAGSESGYTWYDDGVEVFLDGDFSQNNGSNYGFGIGAQLAITANGASHGNGADFLFGEDDEDDWFAAPSLTDDGYMIEYRILLEKYLNPIDREIIGFNVTINDDDNDETFDDRDMQLMWNGPAHRERCYGTLTLGGPSTHVEIWELF